MIFWRTVRGMLKHKRPKGRHALDRLKVFDGCPAPYDKKKRLVVPSALRVLVTKPGRKFIVLKRLSEENGWKHSHAVQRLEENRLVKSKAYYERKKAIRKIHNKAAENVKDKIKPYVETLHQYGYS